jgi:hypothetical protein
VELAGRDTTTERMATPDHRDRAQPGSRMEIEMAERGIAPREERTETEEVVLGTGKPTLGIGLSVGMIDTTVDTALEGTRMKIEVAETTIGLKEPNGRVQEETKAEAMTSSRKAKTMPSRSLSTVMTRTETPGTRETTTERMTLIEETAMVSNLSAEGTTTGATMMTETTTRTTTGGRKYYKEDRYERDERDYEDRNGKRSTRAEPKDSYGKQKYGNTDRKENRRDGGDSKYTKEAGRRTKEDDGRKPYENKSGMRYTKNSGQGVPSEDFPRLS